jgi:hypothetical protein
MDKSDGCDDDDDDDDDDCEEELVVALTVPGPAVVVAGAAGTASDGVCDGGAFLDCLDDSGEEDVFPNPFLAA